MVSQMAIGCTSQTCGLDPVDSCAPPPTPIFPIPYSPIWLLYTVRYSTNVLFAGCNFSISPHHTLVSCSDFNLFQLKIFLTLTLRILTLTLTLTVTVTVTLTLTL